MKKSILILLVLLTICFSTFSQNREDWDEVNSRGKISDYLFFMKKNIDNKGIYYDSSRVKLNVLLNEKGALPLDFIIKKFEANIAPFKYNDFIESIEEAMSMNGIVSMNDGSSNYKGKIICYSEMIFSDSDPQVEIYEKETRKNLGKLYVYRDGFLEEEINFIDKDEVYQTYSKIEGKWYETFKRSMKEKKEDEK